MVVEFLHNNLMLGVVKSINFLFKRAVGNQKRAVFYDIKTDYPELLAIDANFSIIKEELETVLINRQTIPRFHEVDSLQKQISAEKDAKKNWRTFYLYCYGEKPAHNRALCPKTAALLDSIPGIYQAFFSILEGGKSIPPHDGPFCGILRYHLALKVPQKNPPLIRIKDQSYTWQEGKSVMFDDTWEHEVINHSEEIRVVLFLDIMRRHVPTYLLKINKLLLRSLGTYYGKKVMSKLNWMQ